MKVSSILKGVAVFLFAIFVGLMLVGPMGWVSMGLLVECKYVERCAKESGIEFIEKRP